MRIWGIGANWDKQDKAAEFVKCNVACIGWNKKDAPGLYAMMGQIESGDLIYIKSYPPSGKRNLYIKAIGKVICIDANCCRETVSKEIAEKEVLLKVQWVKEFIQSPRVYTLSDEEVRCNVYNNTLYEEYNPGVIKKIYELI